MSKKLVVPEKPLHFDLLLGYDAIKALGAVLITWMGMVKCVQHSRLTNLTLALSSTSIRRFGPLHGNGQETENQPSSKTQSLNTMCPAK